MILIIDDDVAVRTSLGLLLKQAGYQTKGVATPAEALQSLQEAAPQLMLMDMNFSLDTSGQDGLALLGLVKKIAPQVPVILITGWGSISLAVEGIKAGAAEFVTKPWNNEALLQTIRTILSLPDASAKEDMLSRRELDKRYDFANIVGTDPQLLHLLRSVGQVATTDASVLIEGESGTGKELIAEAIHHNSHRRDNPFVKVNLGAFRRRCLRVRCSGTVGGFYRCQSRPRGPLRAGQQRHHLLGRNRRAGPEQPGKIVARTPGPHLRSARR